jgi:hypothetical protein
LGNLNFTRQQQPSQREPVKSVEGRLNDAAQNSRTKKWSKPPELFRSSEKLVLRHESKSGVQFISIHGNQIESMRDEPDLKNAEKLALKESDENIARMKPM